jgi:hypothetical protein
MSDACDRQKLIEEKIGHAEAKASTGLTLIRQVVRDFLLSEKGYSDEDMEVDRQFEIVQDNSRVPVSVDYILTLGGKRFLVIKCSPGALESRERHIVSFARVVDSYQIPFAVVTDGLHARILNAESGKLVSEGLDSIPSRSQATEILKSTGLRPYPARRMDREKRILLAFEAIKCTQESCE